jgi:hypothetical protein
VHMCPKGLVGVLPPSLGREANEGRTGATSVDCRAMKSCRVHQRVIKAEWRRHVPFTWSVERWKMLSPLWDSWRALKPHPGDPLFSFQPPSTLFIIFFLLIY